MAGETRVCPYCGDPPGPGVFCEACGRNLSAVERLPTREAWEAEHRGAEPGGDAGSLAERCAAATAACLEALNAAGDQATTSMPVSQRRAFGRTPTVTGWIVRPPVRDEENLRSGHYEPGLFLSVQGAYHRLDNEVRGWGQRDFPQFHHSVSAEPVPMPCEEQLIAELRALQGAGERS